MCCILIIITLNNIRNYVGTYHPIHLYKCVPCHVGRGVRTFIMVLLHTGTNFPAVSVNSLLAVAMMTNRQRWNGTGVPTQSQLQAAILTLSA
jgi:hypothetical protein